MSQSNYQFSIIIPTFNRPEQVKDCLSSLMNLNYPDHEYEVIIVDDGSRCSPEPMLQPFYGRLNLVYLKQSHAGPAAARNMGAARAQGKFLVFSDDDCRPSPDWLNALASVLAESPDAAVYGRVINMMPENPFSAASQLLVDFLKEYYNIEPGQTRFITANNLALPAGLYQNIGGFDLDFPFAGGEDREVCVRWLTRGYQILYAPEMIVFHTHKLTFRSYWTQHYHYGRGAYIFQKKILKSGVQTHLEPLSFYFRLISYPLKHLKISWLSLFISILFIISQAATGLGFYHENITRNLRYEDWNRG